MCHNLFGVGLLSSLSLFAPQIQAQGRPDEGSTTSISLRTGLAVQPSPLPALVFGVVASWGIIEFDATAYKSRCEYTIEVEGPHHDVGIGTLIHYGLTLKYSLSKLRTRSVLFGVGLESGTLHSDVNDEWADAFITQPIISIGLCWDFPLSTNLSANARFLARAHFETRVQKETLSSLLLTGLSFNF
jgi:hypothetical protein